MRISAFLMTAMITSIGAFGARQESLLKDSWQFCHGEATAESVWQNVSIPHDWAIFGPFDRNNDLQKVAVEQNGEKVATWKTGRTGGLPFIGKGSYRTTFEIADTACRSLTLLFDGAMSNAHVRVNGKEVGYWPYGYNSFYVDINSAVHPGRNTLEVDLENFEQASRWYPGAGLYRNVHLINTHRVHVPVWGTYVTTPEVSHEFATVKIDIEIAGAKRLKQWPNGEKIMVTTVINDSKGREVARKENEYIARGQIFSQNFLINNPELWSPDTPALYMATTTLSLDGKVVDSYDTRFGIREIKYIPEKGFFLNGKPTKFKGVCNHHDLGPLGAAVNRAALRHQVELLKEMGANAIRTSHNMPAPELVELCDELGMMLMVEPFDDWSFQPKSPNGYGRFFNEWAKRDMENMVKHYRNSPAVVMWSIGNEVTGQWSQVGMDELVMLQDVIHRLDPTRPATCGCDQIKSVLDNGFAASLDIPGFNYKPQYYDECHRRLPQGLILGSETASTVSSRGVYHFPVIWGEHHTVTHPDHQSNSYDNEACSWSNTPDYDFARDEDNEWVIGQFVWTGFDYLGEPSPYDTDAWPNHSSVFGIIDLASLPKDRYYLYRSVWNKKAPTLHILPHWNWKGREGEITPVFVYTSYPKAELFVNGKSCGMREKNDSTLMNRFRLMWNEVRYEPGEVKVVAYDSNGYPAMEKTMRTAGKPHHLVASVNHDTLAADGEDLAYITVQVADKDGNIVPTDNRLVKFKVTGAGKFRATANGDPTCLNSFQAPEMPLFSGALTAIVQASTDSGTIEFTATAKGVKPCKLLINVK